MTASATRAASRRARGLAAARPDACDASAVQPVLAPDGTGWRGRWLVPAAVAAAGASLALALLWGGGAPEPGQPGLPDAGPLTGWALQAATLLYQLAAVAAIGSLLTGVVLTPPAEGTLAGAGLRAVRAATWSAAAWALLATASGALSAAEILGAPVLELIGSPDAWTQATRLAQPRALLLGAATAAAVATCARWVRTPVGGWLLLGGAVLALTPVLFSGHSAQAADHTVAITSLVVHVVAATLWVGGLTGLVLHLGRAPSELAGAVRTFSVLALVCYSLVGGSGLVNAWTRVDLSPAAWSSGYGAIIVAKTVAFLLLGLLGWSHRQHAMRRLAAGDRRSFLRLAAGEVLVMATTLGLAVALARTPTPSSRGVAAVPEHGAGHDTLRMSIEPFTFPGLVTEWQPDLIALSLVGVALAFYGQAILAVRRSGRRWPVARTASFLAGLVVVAFATSGGLAVYAPALFSVHIGRFLALSLLAPLLLVWGRPALLAELAAPARPGSLRALLGSERVAPVLANPVHGFAAYVVVTYALYATPLLDQSLRAVPAHLLASATALAVGLLLVSGLFSTAPSAVRSRITVVIGLAVYLGAFAVVLASRTALYAPAWFGELRWSWAEPLADQRRGAVVLLLAVPLVTTLLLLGLRARRPAAEIPGSRSTGR